MADINQIKVVLSEKKQTSKWVNRLTLFRSGAIIQYSQI